MYALQNKQISKKQYHEAYIIAHQLMIEIEDNFSEIQDKVMRCYHKINHKAQKMKHKRPYKAKKITPTTLTILINLSLMVSYVVSLRLK